MKRTWWSATTGAGSARVVSSVLLIALLVLASLPGGGAAVSAEALAARGAGTPAAFQATPNYNQCDASVDPNNVPDGYEPDQTSAAAKPFIVGGTQDHNLCSPMTLPDEDWMVFTGSALKEYTIETYNLASTVDTLLTVQNGGTVVTNDDGGSTPPASRIIFVPKADGAVYVGVRQATKTRFELSQMTLPRTYSIAISERVLPPPTPTTTPAAATATPTSTPSPCRDAYEYDDTRDQANPLFVKKPQRHILCGDGDIDWIWFDAVADKPYRITTSALAEGLDTIMVLYDQDGETMLQINDDYPGLGLASRIDFLSPVTGRYYLKVQDSVGHGATEFYYTLTLDSDGLPFAGPCMDKYEYDGLPTSAREILLGESQLHQFCPEGDADWVNFFALGGKTYTLATSDLSIGTDTVLMIFGGGDGTRLLARNDDGGGGLASRIDFTAPADATYFAQVKNAGDIGGKGQKYTLTLSSGGGARAATPTPRPTNTTPVSGTATRTPTAGASATPTPTFTPALGSGGPGTLSAAPSDPAFAASLAEFAHPLFLALWQRVDEPVREFIVSRTWYWGAAPGPATREPYKGAPAGERLVQYFDKGRMELNQADDGASLVTSGLLTRELVSGMVAIGDAATEQRQPAQVVVAGDAGSTGPTYASFSAIASLDGDNRVPNRVGLDVIETIDRRGKIREDEALAGKAANAAYVTETGHNIPNVFWSFMHATGPVRAADGYQNEVLVDWVTTFGLPLTEAYWTKAVVGGVERDVLVQLFERRVLTYTPTNDAAWQVEIGNIGAHYYRWRYEE